ncbi:unnamed protein product [Polarella glacialis]|uniref:Uncharacterized protein n=1 Tax=Polarella glacialis TaxID=89957 RepID=A0A813FYX8_POLGL|nr:unnamed protein product [Polarella glacialis]
MQRAPSARSNVRCLRQCRPSDPGRDLSANLEDFGPVVDNVVSLGLVSTILFVAFCLWYAVAKDQVWKQAKSAGLEVVRAQAMLDEAAQREPGSAEVAAARSELQRAKASFVELRKWKVGPFEVELMPKVKEMAGATGHHPSALRNRAPILAELQKLLPPDVAGLALELASSSGAHVEVFQGFGGSRATAMRQGPIS